MYFFLNKTLSGVQNNTYSSTFVLLNGLSAVLFYVYIHLIASLEQSICTCVYLEKCDKICHVSFRKKLVF